MLPPSARGETKKMVHARYFMTITYNFVLNMYYEYCKAFELLYDLMTNKQLLEDILKLSPLKHISSLKANTV